MEKATEHEELGSRNVRSNGKCSLACCKGKRSCGSEKSLLGGTAGANRCHGRPEDELDMLASRWQFVSHIASLAEEMQSTLPVSLHLDFPRLIRSSKRRRTSDGEDTT